MRSRLPLLVLVLACSPAWELPREDATSVSVVVEPSAALDQAPEILRLTLLGAFGRSALADFRLFRGELSDYHLGRLAARDVPKTLLEREVPAVVWAEPPEIRVAPVEVLAPGAYSLATPELGLLATFVVVETQRPRLARLWPPRRISNGNGLSVFCGAAAALVAPGPHALAPAAVEAAVLSGLDEGGAFSETCVRIEPTRAGSGPPAGTLLLPPLVAGEVAFEPLALSVRPATAAPPSCVRPEAVLGPGCVLADDDRFVIRAPETASLWALDGPVPLLGVASPGSSLVVRGLAPGALAQVAGRAFDLAGTAHPLDSWLALSAPRDHLVINEVLANPAGQEARSEWIELVNDGSTSIELGGFELVDTGGAFALPGERLAAGEFALLVGPAFAPDPELDVPVPSATRRLVLTALGKAGLSNGGELLRLVNAEHAVVSRWPALAAPPPGRSLARRTPAAPDPETTSFGPHAAPGASPGAPNRVEPDAG